MSSEVKRLPVTAALIVCNEEAQLRRALSSVAWCDEIVVVDGGSTDASVSICRDPGAVWAGKIKVFEREWSGFKDQRNFSLEKATNDWVFVLDADEECSPELRKKMEEILSTPSLQAVRAYKVHRQEYFLGKPIYYGVWNPSYQDRFFHREGIRYINDVHEYPVYPPNPGRIHEVIRHWPDFNPQKFLEKMNKYTTIEARDRVKAGQRTNLFRIVTAGPAMFFKNYFYYKSYRDGVHGVVISLLEGVSRTVRHIKIWQFQSQLIGEKQK